MIDESDDNIGNRTIANRHIMNPASVSLQLTCE